MPATRVFGSRLNQEKDEVVSPIPGVLNRVLEILEGLNILKLLEIIFVNSFWSMKMLIFILWDLNKKYTSMVSLIVILCLVLIEKQKSIFLLNIKIHYDQENWTI